MRTCKAILKRRDSLCNGTTGLCFEKPDGFEFKPGQFANFTLDATIATDAQMAAPELCQSQARRMRKT